MDKPMDIPKDLCFFPYTVYFIGEHIMIDRIPFIFMDTKYKVGLRLKVYTFPSDGPISIIYLIKYKNEFAIVLQYIWPFLKWDGFSSTGNRARYVTWVNTVKERLRGIGDIK